MYPYFRFAKMLAQSHFQLHLPIEGTAELAMRVWPGDIDLYPEMNNGRHLTIMDLGRLNLAVRTGLAKAAHQRRWGYVAAGGSVRFRRRLLFLQRFTLKTRCLGHDDRWFYFYQTTERDSLLCSSSLLRAGLISAEGVVPPVEVLSAIDRPEWNPELPTWVQAWIEADDKRPQTPPEANSHTMPIAPEGSKEEE